jgi:cell division protein FtsB
MAFAFLLDKIRQWNGVMDNRRKLNNLVLTLADLQAQIKNVRNELEKIKASEKVQEQRIKESTFTGTRRTNRERVK